FPDRRARHQAGTLPAGESPWPRGPLQDDEAPTGKCTSRDPALAGGRARSMLDLAPARKRMVDVQIAGRGVRDARVLEALRRVPRDAFVEPGFEEFAYEDVPLPIGEGQTISQPYIVALMIEAAEVKPGDQVLEVGDGSGYAAAVMSQIADRA